MKFCSDCGAKLEDDMLFCNECGAKQETVAETAATTETTQDVANAVAAEGTTEEQKSVSLEKSVEVEAPQETAQYTVPAQEAAYTYQAQNTQPNTAAPTPASTPGKSNNKLIMIISIVAGASVLCIAAIILVIVLLFTRKATINISEYTDVNFEGYSGYGHAVVNYNSATLTEKVSKETDKNVTTKVYSIMNYVQYSYDESTELKNGDTVIVHYTISDRNKENLEKLGFKVKTGDLKVKVSGLKEVREVNPFDYLEVGVEGKYPYHYYTINVSNDYPYSDDQYLYFNSEEADEDNTKLTVTANEADPRHSGVLYTQTEKTFNLSDFEGKYDSYIFTADDVTEDFKKDYMKECEKLIEKARKDDYFGDYNYENINYEGIYLLTDSTPEDESWNSQSKIYVIYSANVSMSKPTKEGFKKTKVYIPFECTNIVLKADKSMEAENEIDDLYDIQRCYDEFKSESGYYSIPGYLSLEDFEDDKLDEDEYTIVKADGLK